MTKYPYVPYGGDSTLPPPYTFGKTRFYGFTFTADRDVLQKMVDERLNFPSDSGRTYTVAPASQVIISFAQIRRAQSVPEFYEGYNTENEMMIWVLLVEKRKGHKSRLVWTLPFIIVDNFWASVSGREVYGFPKTHGRVTLPPADITPSRADIFGSTVLGFKTYSPDSLMAEFPVIRLDKIRSRGMEDEPEEEELWNDDTEAMKGLRGIIFEDENLENQEQGEEEEEPIMQERGIISDAISNSFTSMMNLLCRNGSVKGFPVILLKQFRGIGEAGEACYQALTETTFCLNGPQGGKLSSKFVLDLPEVASYPIAQELGLRTGQRNEAGFWLTVDFDCPTGKVLWQAK